MIGEPGDVRTEVVVTDFYRLAQHEWPDIDR
jgi:hypothetical protein